MEWVLPRVLDDPNLKINPKSEHLNLKQSRITDIPIFKTN